jgi:2-amino-4-hydroxy-6-hydroxymethyldihydropteridine diphosphokinase
VETDAYIALGSNVGDRELNLLRAVAELGKLAGCRVTALSRFYETSPVGMPLDTPAFYNGVVRLATTRSPQVLLGELQRIERELFGRTPSRQPQSRRMDLDLLLYGDTVLATPELTLPHPRMTARRFVLLPLSDIAADLREPSSNRTVAGLLADLKSDEQVRPLE